MTFWAAKTGLLCKAWRLKKKPIIAEDQMLLVIGRRWPTLVQESISAGKPSQHARPKRQPHYTKKQWLQNSVGAADIGLMAIVLEMSGADSR